MGKKIKAIVDISAQYFNLVHLYEAFKQRPFGSEVKLCSIPVTDYSLEDHSFVKMTCDSAWGEVTLFVPRSEVLLIEEGERFSEQKQAVGFKAEH